MIKNYGSSNRSLQRQRININFVFNLRTFQLCMAAKQDLRNLLALMYAFVCYRDGIPGGIIKFLQPRPSSLSPCQSRMYTDARLRFSVSTTSRQYTHAAFTERASIVDVVCIQRTATVMNLAACFACFTNQFRWSCDCNYNLSAIHFITIYY